MARKRETDIPPSPMQFIIFFHMPLMSESGVHCGAKPWGSCFPRKQVLITALTADNFTFSELTNKKMYNYFMQDIDTFLITNFSISALE